MNRRKLFKGLLALPIFGTLIASNRIVKPSEPERLCSYADVKNNIWIEANLPYGRYSIEVKDNQEVKPGRFVKKVILTKVI